MHQGPKHHQRAEKPWTDPDSTALREIEARVRQDEGEIEGSDVRVLSSGMEGAHIRMVESRWLSGLPTQGELRLRVTAFRPVRALPSRLASF